MKRKVRRYWGVGAAVIGIGGTALVAVPPGVQAAPRAAHSSSASDTARALGLSEDQRLIEKDRFTGPDGVEHVRYDRTIRLDDGELPVLGGDLVVHGTDDPEDVTWAGPQEITPATTTPRVGAQAAETTAARSEHRSGRSAEVTTDAALIVDATGSEPVLSWQVALGDEPASQRTVLVSATDGDVVRSVPANPGAGESAPVDGTGNTLYSGTVTLGTTETERGFILRDPDRGNSRTRLMDGVPTSPDNVWGDGRANNRTALADLHYGIGLAWDFYRDVFDRNGAKDDGTGVTAKLDNLYADGPNALWNSACECIEVAADPPYLASPEVLGHEMTHGVIDATADLNYWDESGGLNESSADIIGTLVEFHSDVPGNPGDYRIGEQFFGNQTPPFLRRMDRPSVDGRSLDCFTTTAWRKNPHYSSGIGNHFFYLLSEGTGRKTFAGLPHNGVTCGAPAELTGIGNADAGRIWYDALRTYMVSTTSYPEARDATIRAAADRYGADSTQCAATTAGWKAVAVPRNAWTCTGAVPGENRNVVANGDFEKGLQGWKTSAGKPRVVTAPNGNRFLRYAPKTSTVTRVELSRPITVPDTAAPRLRYRIHNPDFNTYLVHRVDLIDQSGKRHLIVRDRALFDVGWVDRHLPLAGFAGQRVTLVLSQRRLEGGLSEPGTLLLDDLSLTPR